MYKYFFQSYIFFTFINVFTIEIKLPKIDTKYCIIRKADMYIYSDEEFHGLVYAFITRRKFNDNDVMVKKIVAETSFNLNLVFYVYI